MMTIKSDWLVTGLVRPPRGGVVTGWKNFGVTDWFWPGPAASTYGSKIPKNPEKSRKIPKMDFGRL